MDVYRANWPQYHNCSHRGLGAVTIQYNHEWTRINTNENRRCNAFLPTQSSSPNRDCGNHEWTRINTNGPAVERLWVKDFDRTDTALAVTIQYPRHEVAIFTA